MYSVCSFRYMLANSFCAFLSFRALVLVGFFLLHLEAVFTSARFSLTANVSNGTLYFVLCLVGNNSAVLATISFVDFTKAFDSIHRGKMEQILVAYGPPKETVAAIMMLYRNTKVKVRSPDGDTDYFDIVARVLEGDTQASYLLIICLD